MRRLSAFLIPLLLLGLLAGCGDNPPGDLESRQEKAAGLTAFRITLHEDLWNRTGKDAWGTRSPSIKGKITKHGSGIITVELSGPQTSDLLEKLADYGYDELVIGDTRHKAEARRLYRAIGPVIDRINQTPRAGDPAPTVVVDDLVPGSSTPSPSPSAPKPTASASR